MEYYGMAIHSTIILNLRIWGGSLAFRNLNANPRNPNGSISFKGAFKETFVAQVDQPQNLLGPYIVE